MSPSIKFGHLRYYRLLELVSGDGKIGDRWEGVRKTVVSASIGLGEDQDIENELSLHNIASASGGVMEIKDLTIVNEEDCYILSLAQGNLEDLCDEFCRSGPEAYDAAFAVTDIDELVRCVEKGTVAGRSVSDLFLVTHQAISYLDLAPVDMRHSRKISVADAFEKRKEYARQKEDRIVLKPIKELKISDHIIINIHSKNSMFERLKLSRITGSKPPIDTIELHQFLRICLKSYIFWEEMSTPNNELIAIDYDNPDEYIERFLQKREKDIKDFSYIRNIISRAYWKLRPIYPSVRMDDAILYCDDPNTFLNHVNLYLLEIRGFIDRVYYFSRSNSGNNIIE